MTDRRAADRRQRITPPHAERRHGDRRTYQAGCHCTPCRAANAAHVAQWRLDRAHGRRSLNACVPSSAFDRLLKLLLLEGFVRDEILARAGLKRPDWRQTHRIRLRSARKLQRFAAPFLSGEAESTSVDLD